MSQHPAIQKAKDIVATQEWEGDIRVNMTTVIGAGRVLSRRVSELERIIVKARRELVDVPAIYSMTKSINRT